MVEKTSSEKEGKTTVILSANLGPIIKKLMGIDGFSRLEVIAHFEEGEDYGFRYKYEPDAQIQDDWTEMKNMSREQEFKDEFLALCKKYDVDLSWYGEWHRNGDYEFWGYTGDDKDIDISMTELEEELK